MQFDDFDKKIKEAAEHHHPAYEEKAWDKMEKLLDKHLPNEKEDKRRIFFLLLLLLLTGAGVYLAITKPWQSKSTLRDKVNSPVNQKMPAESPANSTSDAESKTAKSEAAPGTGKPGSRVTDTNVAENKIKDADDHQNTGANEREYVIANERSNSTADKSKNNNANKNQYTVANKRRYTATNEPRDVIADKPQNIAAGDRQNTTTVKPTLQDVNNDSTVNTSKVDLDNTSASATTNIPATAISSNPDSALSKKTDPVAKIEDDKKNTEMQKKEKQKPGRQKKTSAFAITFTAGPDLTTVGLSEIGKINLSYGAGLSYSFNRFTLRSGFYVSKKMYSAGPDEYHPPEHYWTYYVDLDKVDADCKVYEIPVTVSYNFSQSRTHNWFASAGLSTYLMKRETYDYYYKNPMTQAPDTKSWTLKNGNKHFFSIINLSAGYERKLSNKLSLIAEPYIKIPMEGIGFGSIKLNSAGVLFTLSVKPFATKK